MTTELTLSFDMHSFWHAGSGRGRSAVLDAEVIRDACGLPYLPGKTVKGLLRKAVRLAEMVGEVPAGTTVEMFGSEVPGLGTGEDTSADAQDQALERGRFATTPGSLWFGSAELPEDWQRWAAAQGREAAAQLAPLFRVVASTAIDKDGMAREHTLRVVEVAVPMQLRAVVAGPDDTAWQRHIQAALPYLRAVGGRNSRGYGRTTVTIARGGQ
jgi:hypothetical protein